jgi:hypothetical protein
MIWRILGAENVLIKMAENPAEMEVHGTPGHFQASSRARSLGRRQAHRAYIWGDGLPKGMMFHRLTGESAAATEALCDEIHAAGLNLSRWNARRIAYDYVGSIATTRAKADLDVRMKRKYERWAFNGNIDPGAFDE